MLFATNVYAGPFGVEKGMTLEDLRKVAVLKHEKPYMYSAKSLPQSHPTFVEFRLLVTPAHGLCKLSAWSDDITTSAYGTELIEKYDRVFESLEMKYGSHQKFDFLSTGSIWDESRDWMMGLYKNERTLATYWDEEENSNLSEGLQLVKLEAHALSSSKGILGLTYEFTNAGNCMQWIKQKESSAL